MPSAARLSRGHLPIQAPLFFPGTEIRDYNIHMSLQLELLMHAMAALGIGLLIGLERESRQRLIKGKARHAEAAGIRSFAFVSLMGNLLTWLPQNIAPWAILIGFISIAALTVFSYRRSSKGREADIGITSETVLLLTFILGVLTGVGYTLQATIVAIITFALLSYKSLLHRFSHSLSAMDKRQAVQFLIVTVVILPILPDHSYGPFGSLNPQRIWLMVVLICSIGFAAYAGIKILGQRAGLGLTGLLGGLVSSTAVTLAMSRLARTNPRLQAQCVLAVLLACTTMFPRVLALTLIFNPKIGLHLLVPVLGVIAATLIPCWILWKKTGGESQGDGNFHPELNPLSLRMALGFGAFFALIMLLAVTAQHYFGNAGILSVAALSGLSDVDAITLSLNQMARASLAASLAAQGILLACASNSAVKLGIGLVFAPSQARRWLLLGLLPMIAISIAAMFWA